MPSHKHVQSSKNNWPQSITSTKICSLAWLIEKWGDDTRLSEWILEVSYSVKAKVLSENKLCKITQLNSCKSYWKIYGCLKKLLVWPLVLLTFITYSWQAVYISYISLPCLQDGCTGSVVFSRRRCCQDESDCLQIPHHSCCGRMNVGGTTKVIQIVLHLWLRLSKTHTSWHEKLWE